MILAPTPGTQGSRRPSFVTIITLQTTKEAMEVHKIIILVLGVLVSVGAWAQGYQREGSYDFDVVASVASGKVEIDELEGSESIHSMALALDFQRVPIEVELKYSTVDWNPTVTFTSGGQTIGSADGNGTINNVGITAKMDLSWTCRAACVYLLAGYNSAELSSDEITADGTDGSIIIIEEFSIDGDFPHFGAGARYDFRGGARLSVEYMSYRIGDQEGIDFGTATAWQLGLGYRF